MATKAQYEPILCWEITNKSAKPVYLPIAGGKTLKPGKSITLPSVRSRYAGAYAEKRALTSLYSLLGSSIEVKTPLPIFEDTDTGAPAFIAISDGVVSAASPTWYGGSV